MRGGQRQGRGEAGEINEALLTGDSAARLTAENLRVLADDVEQCLQEVTDVVSSRRSAGWAQQYERAVNMTEETLQELRAQADIMKMEARRASRQDQAICQGLTSLYQQKLNQLALGLEASPPSSAETKAQEDDRKAAAAAVLQRVNEVCEDSAAAAKRSVSLVHASQEIALQTATVIKAQTEQLKDIHADAAALKTEIARSSSLLAKMRRRLLTDKLTCVLVVLVTVGIFGCVCAKIVLGPAPLQPLPPYYPPTPLPPPPPSPPPPDPPDSPEPPLSSLYTHTHTHTHTPPQEEKEKQSKAMPHRAKAASVWRGWSRSLPDTPPQAAHKVRQHTSQHTALQSGVHPAPSRAEASTTRGGMKRTPEASTTRGTFLQTQN